MSRDDISLIDIDTGEVLDVDTGTAGVLANVGNYAPATPNNVRDITRKVEDEKVYGGLAGATQTALTSGLRGLTFGLSDLIIGAGLDLTGEGRETITEAEKHNPNIGLASEILGALAPAVATGGSTVTGRIGGAALSKAERHLGKSILKAGLAKRGSKFLSGVQGASERAVGTYLTGLVGSAAKIGAAGALEGATYNTATTLSRKYLENDPEVTADLINNALQGALWGGGIPAGAKIGGSLSMKAVDTLGKSLAGTSRWVYQKAYPSIATARFRPAPGISYPKTDVRRDIENIMRPLNSIGRNTDEMANDLNFYFDAENNLGYDIRAMSNESYKDAVNTFSRGIIPANDKMITDLLKSPRGFDDVLIERMNRTLISLRSASKSIDDIDDIWRNTDLFDTLAEESQKLISTINNMDEVTREALGLSALSDELNFQNQHYEVIAKRRAWERLSTSQKKDFDVWNNAALYSGLGYLAAGPAGLLSGPAANAIRSFGANVADDYNTYVNIYEMFSNSKSFITEAANKIVNTKAGRTGTSFVPVAAAINVKEEEKPEEIERWFRAARSGMIQSAQQLAPGYLEPFASLPRSREVAMANLMKSFEVIESELPSLRFNEEELMMGLESNVMPTAEELTKIKHIRRALNNPNLIIQRIGEGTASPDERRYLEMFYPGLYSLLKRKIVESLGDNPSRSTKRRVAKAMGIRRDALRYQVTWMQEPQQPETPPGRGTTKLGENSVKRAIAADTTRTQNLRGV